MEAGHQTHDLTPENQAQSRTYGQHLLLRLANIERVTELDSPPCIARFLSTLVSRIDMTVLDGPFVCTENGDRAHYGHSGVIVLVESHCAIHTYPFLAEVFLDVFSCKHFDVAKVLDVFADYFGHYTIRESTVVDRGYHWGTDAAQELVRWNQAR